MTEEIIVQGLVKGGVYALLAVGFSLSFGVARIVNLAHASFYMLAAYGIYTFANVLGLVLTPQPANAGWSFKLARHIKGQANHNRTVNSHTTVRLA